LLTDLRTFRLQAKADMRAQKPAEQQHFHALQNTFKILINSFYGYLGFARGILRLRPPPRASPSSGAIFEENDRLAEQRART